MSKKINQLDPISDAHAKNDSYLLAQADPINGKAEYITVAQAKEVYCAKSYLYVATGAEGNTLTIPQVQGYMILMILRESGPIFQVGTAPASNQFTWDDIDIVLGTAVGVAGEQFQILYRTY